MYSKAILPILTTSNLGLFSFRELHVLRSVSKNLKTNDYLKSKCTETLPQFLDFADLRIKFQAKYLFKCCRSYEQLKLNIRQDPASKSIFCLLKVRNMHFQLEIPGEPTPELLALIKEKEKCSDHQSLLHFEKKLDRRSFISLINFLIILQFYKNKDEAHQSKIFSTHNFELLEVPSQLASVCYRVPALSYYALNCAPIASLLPYFERNLPNKFIKAARLETYYGQQLKNLTIIFNLLTLGITIFCIEFLGTQFQAEEKAPIYTSVLFNPLIYLIGRGISFFKNLCKDSSSSCTIKSRAIEYAQDLKKFKVLELKQPLSENLDKTSGMLSLDIA